MKGRANRQKTPSEQMPSPAARRLSARQRPHPGEHSRRHAGRDGRKQQKRR